MFKHLQCTLHLVLIYYVLKPTTNVTQRLRVSLCLVGISLFLPALLTQPFLSPLTLSFSVLLYNQGRTRVRG